LHGVLLLKAVPLSETTTQDMLGHWCELTGDSDIRGQDLRPLKCWAAGETEATIEGELSEGMASDLLEVFKYPLKVSMMAPADRWQAFKALSRRRLIRSFGCLWGMEPAATYLDEFDGGDLPYYELLCKYAGLEGYVPAGRRLVEPGRGFFVDNAVRRD
jgi:hypothetical protein